MTCVLCISVFLFELFFCQAEDCIRYLVRSRGLGDVYKKQGQQSARAVEDVAEQHGVAGEGRRAGRPGAAGVGDCLLYTSDAADGRSRVDIGGRRIRKKKKKKEHADTSH